MAKRGPKRKSQSAKQLEGTTRKDRDGGDAPAGRRLNKAPKPPGTLYATGQQKWTETCRRMIALGLLTEADLHAVEIYCKAWDDLEYYEQTLDNEGYTFTTEKGYTGPHPLLKQAEDCRRTLREYQALLGLHPAARTSIRVMPPGEGGPGKVASRKR